MRLSFLLSASVLAMVGCSGSEERREEHSQGVTTEQLSALHTLEIRSGASWSMMQHDVWKTPAHVEGRMQNALKLEGQALEQAGYDATVRFLEQNRALFRMSNPAAEFQVKRARTDALAMTHVRLQQTVRGVRVLGAELMAHYDAHGDLRTVDANYVSGLDTLDVNPTLTREDAQTAALVHMGSVAGQTVQHPELVVYPSENRAPKLAYTMLVRQDSDARRVRQIVVVDAKNGSILESYSNLQTLEATGTTSLNVSVKFEVAQENGRYVMKDAGRGNGVWTYTAGNQQNIPGTVVSSNSLTSWDQVVDGRGAAVDAHYFAAKVYDYYKTTHNRLGLDGANQRMISSVHYGQDYANAFWDGEQMAYGDGDGGPPFSSALDVVAHEFTHGVTTHESNLTYMNQSGALNEAISDILGSAIEHAIRPDATKNWLIGEDLGMVGRSFPNPKSQRQPDHMSGFVRTTQDNGGVHINSGIINNAIYLMTMGGTNSTSGKKVERGIGWDTMAKLVYRANEQYLMSSSSFTAMATAMSSAANDLGLTEDEKKIVSCAFKVVGVDTSGPCAPLSTQAPSPGAGDAGTPTSDGGSASVEGEPTPGQPNTAPDDANGETAAAQEEGGELQFVDQPSTCTSGGSPGPGTLVLAAVAFLLGRRRPRSEQSRK